MITVGGLFQLKPVFDDWIFENSQMGYSALASKTSANWQSRSIHRCQGDTLDEVVVDFPASTREHMHYFGLSRVRNSSALHILNLNKNKIKVTDKVKNEMSRLRTEASLIPLAALHTMDLP